MRATYAVTYSIASLEQDLGVVLFDRERTRKPKLTKAGIVVLAEAKTLSAAIDNLWAEVTGLKSGLESELANNQRSHLRSRYGALDSLAGSIEDDSV